MAETDFSSIIAAQGDFVRGLQDATRSLVGLEVAFRAGGRVISTFMDALGLVPGAGKAVQAAFATAAAEVTLFAGIVGEATEALTSFRDAMLQSGGTAADVAGLGVFGIGSRQAAREAAAFTQRTAMNSSNLFAPSELLKLGVRPGFGSPVDELTGNVNQAGRLAEALDRLNRNYERDRQAAGADPTRQRDVFNQLLGRMRLLGLESHIGDVLLPRQVIQERRRDAALQQEIMDPQAQAQAAALNAELGRLGTNFQLLITALGKPFLEDLTQGIGALAEAVGWAAREVNKHPTLWRVLLGAMFPVIRAVDTAALLFGRLDDAFQGLAEGITRFVDVARLAFAALMQIGQGAAEPTQAAAAAAAAAADLQKARDIINAPFGTGRSRGTAGGAGGDAGSPFATGDPWYHGGARPGPAAFGGAAGDPLAALFGDGAASGRAGATLPGGTRGSGRGFFDDMSDAFKGALQAVFPFLDFGGVSGKAGADPGAGMTAAQKEDLDATERLIQALDDVVFALKQGLFGGGDRTRGAIPPHAFDPFKVSEADRKNLGWHMDRAAAARMFRYGGTSID